jgi:hypothetical protein
MDEPQPPSAADVAGAEEVVATADSGWRLQHEVTLVLMSPEGTRASMMNCVRFGRFGGEMRMIVAGQVGGELMGESGALELLGLGEKEGGVGQMDGLRREEAWDRWVCCVRGCEGGMVTGTVRHLGGGEGVCGHEGILMMLRSMAWEVGDGNF